MRRRKERRGREGGRARGEGKKGKGREGREEGEERERESTQATGDVSCCGFLSLKKNFTSPSIRLTFLSHFFLNQICGS